MSDPTLSAALGIEAVQWLRQEGSGFTVRVQGRWRRRRPTGGQSLLVIEAMGARHRFPAMPEPPALSGAAPGTWQLSFSVPESLAPEQAERAWLQVGALVVPLPLPLSGGETPAPAPVADPRVIASEGPAAGDPRQPALPSEIPMEGESERLRAELGARELELRAAHQRAHAERERRIELEQELAEARCAAGEAGVAERLAEDQRIAELEDELERVRRAADETEHALQAAQAARRRAELASPRPSIVHGAVMRTELEALRRGLVAPPPARGAGAAKEVELDRRLLDGEREVVVHVRASWPSRLAAEVNALRADLDGLRAGLATETAQRHAAERRAASLEQELAAQRARSARVREEIEAIRAAVGAALGERATEVTTTERASEPRSSPGGVAEEGAPSAPGPRAQALHPQTELDPERLSEALARLREEAPTPAAADTEKLPREAGRWLKRTFRVLLRSDSEAAGQLLLALLPAQAVAFPGRASYDLVLSETAVLQVTSTGEGPPQVELESAPRPLAEVGFQLRGDLPSVARLLVARPLRRWIRLGVARIRGNREAIDALRSLVGLQRTIGELHEAGVRVDPLLALKVIAAMTGRRPAVDRFTIRYQRPAGLREGPHLYCSSRRLEIRETLADNETSVPKTTLTCPPDELLPVLAGARPATRIQGERRALDLVVSWLEQAQRT